VVNRILRSRRGGGSKDQRLCVESNIGAADQIAVRRSGVRIAACVWLRYLTPKPLSVSRHDETEEALQARKRAVIASGEADPNDLFVVFRYPAANRVFFEFVDQGGIVRGSTSTAITTQ